MGTAFDLWLILACLSDWLDDWLDGWLGVPNELPTAGPMALVNQANVVAQRVN